MISYQVQRNQRSRNLRLRITPTAQVVVSAPLRTSEQAIARFVQEHLSWVMKNQAKIKARKSFIDDNSVMVFGTQYKKIIDTLEKTLHKQPVYIHGQQIHIRPVTQTTSSITRTLETFLKTTAQKYIVPRTQQLAKIMDIRFHSLTLRDQKTRWGSCSSHGGLNFNWRLVQYPTAVIDYVIVHELAHRQEMNHSVKFWAIVAKFDSQYKSHRQWLQKYGSTGERGI